MNDVLKIRWDTGYVNINMPKFFPCSIAKLNKLLKIIRLDREHEQEILAQMSTFFTQRLIELDAEYKQAMKREYKKQAKKAKKDMEWFRKAVTRIG